jgi:hypothetical protein
MATFWPYLESVICLNTNYPNNFFADAQFQQTRALFARDFAINQQIRD